MSDVITNNFDLWTSAILTKSTAGRGNNGKQQAYGIKKLRELILELAVRGKLVPQDPNNEPASVLLEKIAKEKARLVKVGEIKKEKSLPDIGDDEKPFSLPHGWAWRRLQDVSSYIQRGKGPRYSDYGKVQVVSQKCIQWSGFDLTQARYVDDMSMDVYRPERFLRKDDLLWNSTGTGTVGRINVVPEIKANALVADSHVTVIRPLMVNSRFLCGYVAAPGIQQRIEPEHENSLVSGTTKQVELNLSAVIQLAVPVAPLAEQHRIVAKVDELMALCDQLEQQQTHSLEAYQTLVETLRGTLTNVDSAEELAKGWTRIANHFDTLFTTEHSIDQLKQTILQLAVIGKLVPQDPNDESASVLLGKIAEEKERLIKDKKIKMQKPLPEIGEEAMPFVLPNGWVWTKLVNIIQELKYGTSKMCDYTIDGDPILRIPNVVRGYVDSTDLKFTVLDEKERKELSLNEGDLLIIRSNGSLSIVGRSTVVDDLHSGFMYAGYLVRARFNTGLYNSSFLKLMLDSKLIRDQIELPIRTTSGVKNINSTEIGSLIMPAVPINEQHRIVAKVDELMALCDALKTRLADAQTTQIHLADAIVEQAVA